MKFAFWFVTIFGGIVGNAGHLYFPVIFQDFWTIHLETASKLWIIDWELVKQIIKNLS